ncbi:MAG: DNA polymerase III subunit chi [Desulfuromonadales bacterium]|nr:DNA polymerase III subunit chi [Desulfuromonadales bacterium]NIS39873.1 DNA polymerase III subunit chi [Desulfuromonadales bacterium]
MTRVEFVRLKKPEKARHLCELAERYFQEGQRSLISVLDDNQGVTLDRFMWTWKKGSFIPHCFDNGAVECLEEPVAIVTEESNPNNARILIMGKPLDIDFMRQFTHVFDFAELYDDELAEQSRQRYAAYRRAGFDVAMHQ